MISGSSLELRDSQTTPVPDYEVDPVSAEAQLSDRDVWGNVERYRSVVPSLHQTDPHLDCHIAGGPRSRVTSVALSIRSTRHKSGTRISWLPPRL